MFVAFYLVGKCDYVAAFFFRSFVAHHGFNLWDGSGQNTVEVQFSVTVVCRTRRACCAHFREVPLRFSQHPLRKKNNALVLSLSLLDCT